MAAEDSEGTANKVIGRPFKKGQSGNPSGRPKTDPEIREALYGAGLKATQKLIKLIDSSSDKIALQACVEILNRILGKPEAVSKLEISDNAPKMFIVKWQDQN